MVPKGWHRTTVGDLCELINGNGFKPSDWAEEGLPIIRIQNLNGSTDFNYFAGTPTPRWIVSTGDILFAWAGSKGISFGAKRWLGPQGVLNQHIFRVVAKTAVDTGWLYEALRTVTERVENQAHGFKATLLHVQKADITEQPLLVPPLSEQQKIAGILSTWDRAITAAEQLLTNSQQQKKALLQRLLTGKKRFPKFQAGGEHKKTKYGEIPADWGFLPMASIAKQISKKNIEGEGHPVLSCSKHYGFVNSLDYFNKKVYSADVSGYKIIERGCFGFPSNHIEEGSIGYQDICDTGIVSPIYIVFRANEQVIDNQFLYALLKTEHYKQIFSAATNASVDRRGSLRWDDFSKIKVPLPSLEEQRAIASTLSATDREIETLQQQLAGLKQEKKALMQQLLAGKRRVSI